MKVAIIGAGPAGLALAHRLTKGNVTVDIYDNAKEVGGFSKSISLWDKKIEIGPHFLKIGRNKAVENLILQALQGNYKIYQRKTFILTANKLFLYPPTASDIFRKLSFGQLWNAVSGILKQIFIPVKPDGTAECFVKGHLGVFLYNYFFENFSKKLWSLNGTQIAEVFARSLIGFNQGFSPLQIIYNKLRRKSMDGNEEGKYVYPIGGFSTLWEAMKHQIELQGGVFYLDTHIKSLSCTKDDPNRIINIVLENGTNNAYDYFVSTIPVLSFLSYLQPEQFIHVKSQSRIKFRNDVLLYLKIEHKGHIHGQCFYIYTEDIKITRVTNFNEFDEDENSEFSIILVEFWCGRDDVIWSLEKDALVNLALTELKKAEIFSQIKILDAIVKKVENAFQVPDLDFLENRENLFAQLSDYRNLKITGRNASINFNYGIVNAIEDGLNLADELMSNG